MPTIDVPSPLATYLVYGVFACLCFGQFAIGFFVPQRYRRNRPATLLEQRRSRAAAKNAPATDPASARSDILVSTSRQEQPL